MMKEIIEEGYGDWELGAYFEMKRISLLESTGRQR